MADRAAVAARAAHFQQQKDALRDKMLAHWAAKRGEETPEQRARREARTEYYRRWRAKQGPEWHALKAVYDKEWHKRQKAAGT